MRTRLGHLAGPAWLRTDLIAGLSLSVVLVPQALAYAALAGMPPITGLYCALVGLLVYALLGSSRHLEVGPAALISLLTASAVGPLAGADPGRFVTLAGLLAAMVGALLLVMGLLRLGILASFLSHAVVSGFTSAAAIVIAVSQLDGLLGAEALRRAGLVEAVTRVPQLLVGAHPATVAVGAASLALMIALRRAGLRLPGPLLVAGGAMLAVWLLDLEAAGVTLVGTVPAGLPLPSLPAADLEAARALLPAAVAIALIAYAESMSIGKAVAIRTRTRLDANRELFALGAVNLATGVFGAFPAAGSFTRTVVRYDVGARTQAAGVVAAGVVVLVLTLLSPAFAYLPEAVLAATVLMAVASLVDVRAARQLARASRLDAATLLITFVATLAAGAELGLLTGVAFMLLGHLIGETRPRIVELGRVSGTRRYRSTQRYQTHTDACVAILRIDAPLLFTSAQALADAVNRLVTDRPHLRAVILSTGSVARVDATGIHALTTVVSDLADADVQLHLATVRTPVRNALERTELWARLADRCHPDIRSALETTGVPSDSRLRCPKPDETQPGLVT